MECCERNDLIEPVGCKDGTLPPKLMAEFLHPPGVDQPPRTLAVVHPIPLPQSSTSIFEAAGFYDIAGMSTVTSIRRHVIPVVIRRKTKLHLSCSLSNFLEHEFRAG